MQEVSQLIMKAEEAIRTNAWMIEKILELMKKLRLKK